MMLFLLFTAGAAPAQQHNGNLYGVVKDEQGHALPGVMIVLTGIGASKQTFTNTQGSFHFLGIDPGGYTMQAELEGFSPAELPGIGIRTGHNTTIELTLSAVSSESNVEPLETQLLDERTVQQGTTISQIELEKVPTARDPWTLVTQASGVLSDRVNVGGNESGRQATFASPGVSSDENAFMLDGVNVTNMEAIGSSLTFYDFDQFQEVKITTGGSDITKVNAGVSIDLVSKRGSNTPRGSARFLLTDRDDQFGLFGQGSVDIVGDLAPGQDPATTPGNTVNEIIDFGFEAGGPIKKDVVWFWGAYGRTDIKQFDRLGRADDTLLENTALKLNAQLGASRSLVGSWNRGDKIRNGLQATAATTGDASWNQTGPSEIWKVEASHVLSSRFYLSGLYAYVDGGTKLASQGGAFGDTSAPEPVLDTDGFWKNSYYGGFSDRTSLQGQVDGSIFLRSGAINHELRFGASYRQFESDSRYGWPGRNFATETCEARNDCLGREGGDDLLRVDFSIRAPTKLEYAALFAQDTLSRGRWTLNAGLRYDQQEGANGAFGADAHPVFPRTLPGFSIPRQDGNFDWASVSPRVAFTYALGVERKTLVRVSLARFAQQLSSREVSRISLGSTVSRFSVRFNDVNENNRFDVGEPSELDTQGPYLADFPGNPLNEDFVANRNDPDLDPSITDELIASIEHALLPGLVVTLETTYRRTRDILEERQLTDGGFGAIARPLERDDFVFDRTVSGTIPGLDVPFSADFYRLAAGVRASLGGSLLTNGDSEVEYAGVSLTATKRLSNRWLARGFINVGDAEWRVGPESRRFDDPNLSGLGGNVFGSDIDGGLFAVQLASPGTLFNGLVRSSSNRLIQSGWSANLNGLYQVAPDKAWGFNIAGNLYAREGYPLAYTFTTRTSDHVVRTVLVSEDLDQLRTDDIFITDLRIEKDIPFSSNLSGTLSLDAFNVFNERDVLARDRALEAPTANFLTESLAPRIFRLGLRLSFR